MIAIINGKLVFPDRITDGTVLIDGDRIIAASDCLVPEGCEIIDAKGLYVGPGLFDEHVHGYKQYGECIDAKDDSRTAALAHLKHGTTQITPSAAYSLTKEEFLSQIDQCNKAIEDGDTNIVGIHFEGPFTNPKHGANAHLTWEFSEEACSEIFERAGKNVLHCTYAPEMPHGERMEEVLKKYGVIGDIGHTRADEASLLRAVKNGARIVTHLFDAMGKYGFDEAGQMTPGGLGLQGTVADILLGIPGMYYELICDSRCIHVNASSMRLALRCAGEDHIICISDTTGRPNQLDPADYSPDDPKSATDLNFNQLGQLSGSRLVTAQSVAHFMRETGSDVRVGFKVGSTNSAKALDLYDDYGSIDAGKYANIIFVDEKFTVKKVIFKGNELPEIRD